MRDEELIRELKKQLDSLHYESLSIAKELRKLKKNLDRDSDPKLSKQFDELDKKYSELDSSFRNLRSRFNSARGTPKDDYLMTSESVVDWDPNYWEENM